jgi:hypothetical protein
MIHSIRTTTWISRSFGFLAAAILIAAPSSTRAAAIWSADAAAINAAAPGAAPPFGAIGAIGNNFFGAANINGGLVLGNGNSYTFASNFAETTTPGIGGTTASALMILNIQITAGAANVGAISDTMWFFSDVFPGTLPGTPGFVGMAGSFSQAGGAAQAEMDFNGTLGGLPASAFLQTPLILSPGANVGFATLVQAPIPVSTNQLTGLLGFTLNPGESLTLPFDFSDDVPLTTLVPEPSSMLLMALGVIPLAAVARAKSKRAKGPRAA